MQVMFHTTSDSDILTRLQLTPSLYFLARYKLISGVIDCGESNRSSVQYNNTSTPSRLQLFSDLWVLAQGEFWGVGVPVYNTGVLE